MGAGDLPPTLDETLLGARLPRPTLVCSLPEIAEALDPEDVAGLRRNGSRLTSVYPIVLGDGNHCQRHFVVKNSQYLNSDFVILDPINNIRLLT